MESSATRVLKTEAKSSRRSRYVGISVMTRHYKISKASIKRIARRGGVRRISDTVYEETTELLKTYLKCLIDGCVAYSENCKRNTILANDVVRTLRSRGQRLHGFEDLGLQKSVRRNARVIADTDSVTAVRAEETGIQHTKETFARDELNLNAESTGLNIENSGRNGTCTGRIIQDSDNEKNRESLTENCLRNDKSTLSSLKCARRLNSVGISPNSERSEENHVNQESTPTTCNSENKVYASSIISNSDNKANCRERVIQSSGEDKRNITMTLNSEDIITVGISDLEQTLVNTKILAENSCRYEGKRSGEQHLAEAAESHRIVSNSENNVKNKRLGQSSGGKEKNILVSRIENTVEADGMLSYSDNRGKNTESVKSWWNEENIPVIRNLVNNVDAGKMISISRSMENVNSWWNDEKIPIIRNSPTLDDNLEKFMNSESNKGNKEIISNCTITNTVDTGIEPFLETNQENIEIIRNSTAANTNNQEIIQNSEIKGNGLSKSLDQEAERAEITAISEEENSQSSFRLDNVEILITLTCISK